MYFLAAGSWANTSDEDNEKNEDAEKDIWAPGLVCRASMRSIMMPIFCKVNKGQIDEKF